MECAPDHLSAGVVALARLAARHSRI
jgi:hypothetical protein